MGTFPAAGASSGSTNNSASGASTASSAFGTPTGGSTATAGIIGVASDSDLQSILVYNTRQKYKEWEFIAVQSATTTTPAASGTSTNGTNSNGTGATGTGTGTANPFSGTSTPPGDHKASGWLKMYHTLSFHPGPRVATIVLNRPPLNIINLEMMDELNAAWDEIDELDAQVIVISGGNQRAFSAGVDIADHVPDRIAPMLSKFHRLIRRVFESDRITIAAVHGPTLGGGAELAMVCDFVVAASDASIGQPEISLGCYPPVAAAYLPRAIGFHRASKLVLLGEPIAAVEAERIGLISCVVPREELSSMVDSYVDRLLTKSAAVIALTKKALREGLEDRFEKALDMTESIYRNELAHTEDMREGIQSFLEKRPPSWKNR